MSLRIASVILALVYSQTVFAQDARDLRRQIDSIRVIEDSLETRRDAILDSLKAGGVVPIATQQPHRAAWPWLVAVPFVEYLAGARDHDPGGYRDSFHATSDKIAHCGAQGLITAGLIHLRVSPKWAALASVLGSAAYEFGQRHGRTGPSGYFSAYDATYGAACSSGVALFSVAF